MSLRERLDAAEGYPARRLPSPTSPTLGGLP